MLLCHRLAGNATTRAPTIPRSPSAARCSTSLGYQSTRTLNAMRQSSGRGHCRMALLQGADKCVHMSSTPGLVGRLTLPSWCSTQSGFALGLIVRILSSSSHRECKLIRIICLA